MSLPRTPFGSVCHLVNGKAFKPTDWSGAGVPIIRIQNLNGPDKPFNYWAGALDKQVLVKTGDLLLAWSGTPGTSFGAHIWSGPSGILNQHIFRCDLHQKAITKEWARIAVNHRLHRLIEQAHGGVGLQHVTRGMVEELEIPLPPLAEQRRIAEVLDRAEALRAKRRTALAQLDSLTQSLFLDLFGDPATNPKGWPAIQLGDVVFSVSDGPHVSPSYVESGIPFLSTRHVRPGGMSWEDLKFISLEEAQIHWRKCKPERGDILYTKGGTTGIAKVVDFDEPVAIWVHIALLKTDKSKVEPLWLEAMLNAPFCYQQSQRLTRGIANRDLGLTRMVTIKMYLPPIELQRKFARRVGAVEKLKAAQRASLAELDALFATLQHRAFRGEL